MANTYNRLSEAGKKSKKRGVKNKKAQCVTPGLVVLIDLIIIVTGGGVSIHVIVAHIV
jgi:hypothetical protein